MKTARHKQGFSLVELVIALGVTSFCLLSIMGLLVVGLQGTQSTGQQTAAVGIGSAIVADLKVTTPGGDSPQFAIHVPAVGNTEPSTTTLYFDGGGTSSTSRGSTALFAVSITMTPPASGKTATIADVTINWPAQATDTTKYQGTWETIVSLDNP
jgi:uncharacterized protein (TIGR02598 family)